jgi:hypothetical protein
MDNMPQCVPGVVHMFYHCVDTMPTMHQKQRRGLVTLPLWPL